MRYLIGLDNGGTTTKAALFDIHGKEICMVSASTELIMPYPDFAERDMEKMWQTNCELLRVLVQRSQIRPEQVAGIGICGHGKGVYLWGTDEKPVRNAITSSDNRAYAYVENWRADGTEQTVFTLSYQHVMPCQPVALLAWLQDHEPACIEKIKWIFSCKDYIRYRMTGEARAELTDCSGTNFLNLRTRQYDSRLLKCFGLEWAAEKLPPLCRSTEICGYVTPEAAKCCGLAAGTPVIGGMFDIDACALATGVIDDSHVCMIAGTWSINEYPRREPVLDGSVRMNSLFLLPDRYLIEESSATSAGNNDWFIKKLLPEVKQRAQQDGVNIYDITNQLAQSVAPETLVPVFLPFLMGSNVHPNAKGCFVGMTANQDRRHLIRSVYEGIAFCHRYHFEKLNRTRQTPVRSIRLAGGAARSKIWTQIFADVMQLPIETIVSNETGTLGCAIAAAVAIGEYATLEEAVQKMTQIAPMVQPNPRLREVYDEKYKLYCLTVQCLEPLWGPMQSFVERGGRICWKD